MRLLLSSSRARHGISGLLAVSYWAALLVLAAAAETAPRPAAQPEAPVESWGTTGQAPQTGSSAHTSGRAFRARIVVAIDKAAQEMKVFVDSVERYVWKVSTGTRGYDTPVGSYTARSMNEIWYSRQWDDAPMPHAIFFTRKGHAIHGTEETRKLGRPASHGCVRLAPDNARTLFALVKQTGLDHTAIVLAGKLPKEEVKPRTASRKPQVKPASKPARAVLRQPPGGKPSVARSEPVKPKPAAKQKAAAKSQAKPAKQFDPYAVGTPRRLSRRELRRLYQSGQPPPSGY